MILLYLSHKERQQALQLLARHNQNNGNIDNNPQEIYPKNSHLNVSEIELTDRTNGINKDVIDDVWTKEGDPIGKRFYYQNTRTGEIYGKKILF